MLKRILFFSVMGITLLSLIPAFALVMKTYVSSKDNYSIGYPADYQAELIGTRVIFASREEDKKFGFSPNVNIVVAPLDNPKMSLEDFFAQAKTMLPLSWGNVDFVSEKKDKINGKPAFRLICTTKQRKAAFKIMQALLINKGNAYVITYTALLEQYNGYLRQAEAMINSFKILK
jgi:hypothetical protein